MFLNVICHLSIKLLYIYVQRVKTKLSASIMAKSDIKNEYLDWHHTDRNSTPNKTSTGHRSSSAELAEKEVQEVIKDLLVLNQLSSSSLLRNSKDNNEYKKHSSSISMYSHSPDLLASSPLGVIHHPTYRNTHITVCISPCNHYLNVNSFQLMSL